MALDLSVREMVEWALEVRERHKASRLKQRANGKHPVAAVAA
jgi:hypothetical protein